VVEEEVCGIREERDSFFENGTDASDRWWSDTKCLVFGERVFVPLNFFLKCKF
jgi:hypothetical protein